MKYELRFCDECGEYTLKGDCKGSAARTAHPPKFSPDDKYSKYRLRVKKKEWGV